MNKLVHVIAVLGGCVIARLDRAILPKDYRVEPDNDTSSARLSPICTEGKLAVCTDYSKVDEATQSAHGN